MFHLKSLIIERLLGRDSVLSSVWNRLPRCNWFYSWMPCVALLAGLHWASSSLAAAEPELKMLDELIARMSSEDKAEKRDASYRISQMGPEAQKAVPVLIKALEDRDDQVWFNSITALARIGPGAKEAVPALIGELEQANRGRYRNRSQYRAAFALGSIGPDALPALRKALSSSHPHVRAGAAKALTWIGASANDLIPELIENLGDENEDVRQSTEEALGAIGLAAREPCLAVLRNGKSKTDAKIGAARALGWMENVPKENINSLIETYENQSNPGVRAALIRTLDKWRCDAQQFLPILLSAFASDEEVLREASADCLLLMEPPSTTSVPALIQLLAAKDERLRERVARLLGAIGEDAKAAVGPLKKWIDDHSISDEARQIYQEALAAITP